MNARSSLPGALCTALGPVPTDTHMRDTERTRRLENGESESTEAAFDLLAARNDLARANQLTAMGSFAACVAHEINQPLTSLVAHADAALRWLNRAEPDLNEVASSLESIRHAGQRAADIVAALRAIAKQAPAPVQQVALDSILDEVLKIVANDIASHGVRLSIEKDDACAKVVANPTQIQQVLFNLITNALQSMANSPEGERRLQIRILPAHGSVQVAIADSGCGMTREVLERIFQPFFTTKATGMGVGLAICRSIMEMHGGTLEASSVAGRGSTFLLRMPLGPE